MHACVCVVWCGVCVCVECVCVCVLRVFVRACMHVMCIHASDICPLKLAIENEPFKNNFDNKIIIPWNAFDLLYLKETFCCNPNHYSLLYIGQSLTVSFSMGHNQNHTELTKRDRIMRISTEINIRIYWNKQNLSKNIFKCIVSYTRTNNWRATFNIQHLTFIIIV